MPRKVRDYQQEYRDYHGTPEQKKNNSLRKKARYAAEKRLGKAALKGKEIDHVKPLSKGGSNNPINQKIMSRKANRQKYNK